ncbi:MAG: MBG domain-containing protein [Candidatus Sulfotelmatobacter sp.]|jgi:hypothetical protein
MKRLLMPATALMTLKNVAFTLLCCTVFMVFAAPNRATAQTLDPCSGLNGVPSALPVGQATGCGVIITIPPSGQASAAPTGEGPYDGSDDTLVGIINNSGAPLSSITLSAGTDIFGFDGDGPCNYAQFSNSIYSKPANPNDCFNYPAGVSTTAQPGADPYDYQGPDNTFTNYGSLTTGTVNFITPIPNGGSTWFALEGPPSGLSGVTFAPILIVTELGTGTGTVTDNQTPQVINCGEANGYPTGTCTGTYPSSITSVTLTATPNATASSTNPNGSEFLQWGGACASIGTTSPPYTCTLTLPFTSSQSVTADFAPIPTPVPFTINAGTNVIAQAEYACPSGTSPCTDPYAYGFSMQFPVVSTPFPDYLYIVATEVYADGLCPPGGTTPTSDTTLGDFDCRFASFWNYGTDNAGNTVVPLCDPYANGNCVHFDVYDGSFGTEPPITSYTGPVFETFSFSDSTSSPPTGSYWAGSTTRAIADPDADESTPSVPWGTNCESTMSTEGATPPAINCQFDLDVTAFIDTGGKTNQANDFVVAFQPTVAPPITNSSSTPIPTPVAPTIAGSCVTSGCTVSDPSTGATITFTEGTGGTFEVTVPAPEMPTPYPAPNLTAATTGTTTLVLPNGLTYNGSTGVVSGTPADGTAGSYPITFTANNGVTPAPNNTLSYTLTVNPAGTLSIAASNGTMTYGGTLPTINPIITGAVNGDSAATLGVTCTTSATSSSPVSGTYTSSCTASAIPSSTYSNVTYPSGTVTVKPATGLIITASSATMTYGGTVPTITASVTGLAGSDTVASLGTITCSTTATSTSSVIAGPYSSSCSVVDANYYPITYVPGTVTVKPATGLTITASSPKMTYGGAVPTITAAVTGLAGSDTVASLGTITCSTTATSTSPVIASPYYPSSCSVVDANYSPITDVSGTVQVTPAPLTITANKQSKNYGVALALGTTAFTTSTLYNGNTVTSVTLTSTGAAAAAAPGTYSIVPSAAVGTGLTNYTITFVNGTLTVSALEITPLNAFGTVYLNGVGLQLITLTNKGTTGFTISGLSITAPGNALADYLTANITLCPPMIEKLPATLPAGKSCTIGVGIHPTVNIFSPIASTATFMIADTAAGNPHSFPLTALVIDPLASFNASGLSSGKLTFPTTPVSSTNTVSITVTNSGKSQLIFGTPAISGSGDFTVVTGTSTCIGATVQPAGMCVINVKFAPTKSGTFTGTLTINDNANPTVENNPQTITLSGTT